MPLWNGVSRPKRDAKIVCPAQGPPHRDKEAHEDCETGQADVLTETGREEGDGDHIHEIVEELQPASVAEVRGRDARCDGTLGGDRLGLGHGSPQLTLSIGLKRLLEDRPRVPSAYWVQHDNLATSR